MAKSPIVVRRIGDNFNVYVDGTRVATFDSVLQAARYKSYLLKARKLHEASKKKNPGKLIKSKNGWIKAKAIKIVRGKLLIKR